MRTTEKPTGIAVAALWAAALGVLALAGSHILADRSKSGEAWVHAWGKAWMPGAEGIGPYSGKETLALLTWLGSWILLHLALRRKNVSLTAGGVLFLVGVGLATALLWPPVTGRMVHLLQGGH
ncbi:MAG: hypothetical protein HYZ93_00015 [Candidatus Omnitrophica bacterium]|nr:hypothetical protein [Candidatus Omnitrophota bacterium]